MLFSSVMDIFEHIVKAKIWSTITCFQWVYWLLAMLCTLCFVILLWFQFKYIFKFKVKLTEKRMKNVRLARQSLPLKLWKLPWWVKSWITVFMTVTHDCVHNEIYILIILAKMPQQNTKILTVLLLFLCLKYRKSGFPSNSTGTASNAKHTNTLCTIIWRQWDDMYALVMTENYSTIPKRWKNQCLTCPE